MHEGKKQKESSYQPIKDKDCKVILTSEQARNVDEDHHEFDHKPAKSEIEKAEFINTKMKKLRKKLNLFRLLYYIKTTTLQLDGMLT